MGIVDIMFYLNRKIKHKVCTVKKIKIPLHHSVLLWLQYPRMSQSVVKVRYESIEEFDELLCQARHEYCQLIHVTIQRHFQTAFFSPGDISQPMRWTQYDMIVLGLADFPEFIEDGVKIILRLTKGCNLAWCVMSNQQLALVLVMTCRAYMHTLHTVPVSIQPSANSCITVMQNTLLDMLTSERRVSSYHYIHVDLYSHNFIEISGNQLEMPLILPIHKWREMLWETACALTRHNFDSDVCGIILKFMDSYARHGSLRPWFPSTPSTF